MLADPDNYSFEGESKELTVLFSDIRSFTTISEGLNATQLKKLLNDFFTPITGIIFDHSGTIDKYVGDMVMAFWGAPIDDDKHRSHAVLAALEMLDKVEALKPEILLRRIDRVKVKGKDKAVNCYQPMCLLAAADASLRQRVDAYHGALDCYYSKDWGGAQQKLRALLADEPNTLLYQIYLDRIDEHKNAELPPEWDGAFTHTSK